MPKTIQKKVVKTQPEKKVEVEKPIELIVKKPVEVEIKEPIVETPQEVVIESKKVEVGMTFDGAKVVRVIESNNIASFCEMSNGTTSWIEDFRVK